MSWVDKELSLAALTGAVTGVAVMIPIVGDGAWSWVGLFMAAVVATGDPVRDAGGFPTSLIVLAVHRRSYVRVLLPARPRPGPPKPRKNLCFITIRPPNRGGDQ